MTLPEIVPFKLDQRARSSIGKVLITGPMSSGTRLLARIVDESSEIEVLHDQGHGLNDYEGLRSVVAITRDREITDQSRSARHRPGILREKSMAAIEAKYPDARWVTYEALVADPILVIEDIAVYLGILPWPSEIEVYDGNAHWA